MLFNYEVGRRWLKICSAVSILCIFSGTVSAQQGAAGKTYDEVAEEAYSQADMELYMRCAGKFEAGHEFLLNLQAQYPQEQQSFFDPYIKNGKGIYAKYVLRRKAATDFAPHTDQGAARAVYDTARRGFDQARTGSVYDQWDYWKSRAKVSTECLENFKETGFLYRTWQDVKAK